MVQCRSLMCACARLIPSLMSPVCMVALVEINMPYSVADKTEA